MRRALQASRRALPICWAMVQAAHRRGWTPRRFRRSARTVIAALVPDEQSFALAGFSFGGLIAEAFTLKAPERIARLAIIASVFDRTEEERAGVADRFAWQGAAVRRLIDAALERWYSRNSVRPSGADRGGCDDAPAQRSALVSAYGIFAEADQDLAGQLGAIAVPP